jgi:DNA-binding NarL/FixJ family response regulator
VPTPPSPLPSVAAVDDYELVVAGLAALLARYPDRLAVRGRILVGEPITNGPIDVALYDTYGRAGISGPALEHLAREPDVRHVAVFSLDLSDHLIADASAAGATSFISKALSADEIVDAIEAVARGEDVMAVGTARPPAELDWPGRAEGLTQRESQVVVLLAEGLTNPQIARSLYLSVETVKSHLREAYTKLGVNNRVAAASFVHRSGAFARYQPASALHPEFASNGAASIRPAGVEGGHRPGNPGGTAPPDVRDATIRHHGPSTEGLGRGHG